MTEQNQERQEQPEEETTEIFVEENLRNKRFETLYADTIGNFIAKPHIVIGAGAIGGLIIKTLGQIGVNEINIWDHDNIEEVNIGPQGFKPSEIGSNKVDVRGKEFSDLSPKSKCSIFQSKFSKIADHPEDAFWWLCVDDIDAREMIVEVAADKKFHKIIDTRMGGMNYEVYNVEGNQASGLDKYADSIQFARDNPVVEACTTRSTPHCSMIAAAIGVNMALSGMAPFSIIGDMMSYEQKSSW